MFKNQEEEMMGKETETVIGPSVKVEGDFHGDGSIVVEGQVVGTLKTKQDLRVGKGAIVKADVEATNVYISGEVVGDLFVKDKVELQSSAKVTGDITTKTISIEAGASLNGKCTCDQNTISESSEKVDDDSSKSKSKNSKSSKPEII